MERNSTTTRHRHLPVAEGRPARRLRRRRRWGAAAVLTSFAGVVAACGPDEPRVTAERSVRLAAVEEDDSQGSTPHSDVGAGVDEPKTPSASTSTTVVPTPPPGSAAPAVTLPEELPPATLSTALVPPPAPPPMLSLQDLMITVDDLPEGWTPVYTPSEFRPFAMAAAGWPGARATQESEEDCFWMAQADVIPPIDFSAEALFRSPAEDEWTATYLQFRAGRTSGVLEAVLLEMRLLACDGAPMPGGGTYEMIQLPPLELGDAATAIFLRAHSPIYTSERVLTIVQVGDVVFTGSFSANMEDNLGDVHLLDESLRLLIDRLANA